MLFRLKVWTKERKELIKAVLLEAKAQAKRVFIVAQAIASGLVLGAIVMIGIGWALLRAMFDIVRILFMMAFVPLRRAKRTAGAP